MGAWGSEIAIALPVRSFDRSHCSPIRSASHNFRNWLNPFTIGSLSPTTVIWQSSQIRYPSNISNSNPFALNSANITIPHAYRSYTFNTSSP